MSSPKLKPPREELLLPLHPDSSAAFIRWRLVTARSGESARWQCADGRWVTLSVGTGEQLGHAIVGASDGRRQVVDSYEGGIDLARSWRD